MRPDPTGPNLTLLSMLKLKATATGRVLNTSRRIRIPGKDSFSAWIKLEPDNFNGRVFRQLVKATTYRDVKKMAKTVKQGDWVTISGHVIIDSFEHDDVTYPKILITGRMTRLETIQPDTTAEPQPA